MIIILGTIVALIRNAIYQELSELMPLNADGQTGKLIDID